MVRRKGPDKLLDQCKNFILRYTMNVIWRQVNPLMWIPRNTLFKANVDHPMVNKVPPVTDPVIFRQRFAKIREYFTENLIRDLHDSLAKAATAFITEKNLRHGDVLLRLLFNDGVSKTFELTAGHVIWRRWSVREEATLHRSIQMAEKLTTFVLSRKCTDKILSLLAQHCPNLEILDMSQSFVTDVGLLSICGIKVSGKEESNLEQQTPACRGAYCEKTGRWALAYILSLNNGENPNLKRSDMLKDELENINLKIFSRLLAQKMKPFLDKAESESLLGKPGLTYKFVKFGCRKLKKINLYDIVFPKIRSLYEYDIVFPKRRSLYDVRRYGITTATVLSTLILLPELKELEWTKLGQVLELFQNIHLELGYAEKILKLTSFTDQRPSIQKLEVALRLCPNITRVSCSLIGAELSELNPNSEGAAKYTRVVDSIFFDFEKLKVLELKHLDDTLGFGLKLQVCGMKLTSLSLSKTSLSFPTISLIKKHCQRLKLLEIERDTLDDSDEGSVQLIENYNLPDLRLLRLSGTLFSGLILKYLLSGCPELRVLYYHVPLDIGCEDHITDDLIEDVLLVNPLNQLVTFYVGNCRLTERTFHTLVDKLENIQQIGQLSQWGLLSEVERKRIKWYVEEQNIAIEIDSNVDGWRKEISKIVF